MQLLVVRARFLRWPQLLLLWWRGVDKYGQIAKAEGQRRQSMIRQCPVDIGRMLQMKNGEEEFSFHFADVITTAATATKPSAYFKTRLAYYKTGQSSSSATSTQIHVQGAVSAKDMGNVTASQQSTMNVVSNVRHQATTPARPWARRRKPLHPPQK